MTLISFWNWIRQSAYFMILYKDKDDTNFTALLLFLIDRKMAFLSSKFIVAYLPYSSFVSNLSLIFR